LAAAYGKPAAKNPGGDCREAAAGNARFVTRRAAARGVGANKGGPVPAVKVLEVKIVGDRPPGETPAAGRRVPAPGTEIRVRNRGERRLVLSGCLLLENSEESLRCFNLAPPREHCLAPGQSVALRCSVSAGLLESYERLTLFDTAGNTYPFRLRELRG